MDLEIYSAEKFGRVSEPFGGRASYEVGWAPCTDVADAGPAGPRGHPAAVIEASRWPGISGILR